MRKKNPVLFHALFLISRHDHKVNCNRKGIRLFIELLSQRARTHTHTHTHAHTHTHTHACTHARTRLLLLLPACINTGFCLFVCLFVCRGRFIADGEMRVWLICSTDESVLLDLKHLLMEAKQKIPPVLAALQVDNEKYLDLGGKWSFYSPS